MSRPRVNRNTRPQHGTTSGGTYHAAMAYSESIRPRVPTLIRQARRDRAADTTLRVTLQSSHALI